MAIMGKNKNRNNYESNLLDRAPVDEEIHNESEATAVEEPVVEEPKNEPEPAAPVAEEAPKPAKPKYGFVEETSPRIFGTVDSKKCALLNVREAPAKDGRKIAVVNAGTKLRIDKSESTDSYYRVMLTNGMSGFVAKEFIIL